MTIKLINGKLFLAAVSCLLLFAAVGLAQQPQAVNQIFQTPIGQERAKNAVKAGIRVAWDGRGNFLDVLGMMQDTEFRSAFGVSDEQYQQFQNFPRNMMARENPELKKLQEEIQAIPNLRNLISGQDVDEVAQRKLLDLQSRMILLSMADMAGAIDSHLTPEQKQKLNEAYLVAMSAIPTISPRAFEALHLTETQKQQIEAIKKELEPEFEKHLNQFADRQVILGGKLAAEIEKQGGLVNFRENVTLDIIQERMQVIIQKLMTEDPEFKKIQDEVLSQSRAFSEKFRIKMFDVLTDEQWTRLLALIDNPPVYATLILKKMKERRWESERSGIWQPGPDAWQPGDAIPAQYRQERDERRRFKQETSGKN